MVKLSQIDTPAVLIDRHILKKNIDDMQSLANRYGVALRPHIKTHKSAMIAKMQWDAGASGLTCAKLSEAEMLISQKVCNDIFVANQIVGPTKIHRLLKLNRSATVRCGVDDIQNAAALSNTFKTNGRVCEVLVEVDTGLHRAGLSELSDIVALVRAISRMGGLRFCGIFTHAGHGYGAADSDALAQIGHYEGERMVAVADALRQAGFDVPVVSVGSTPTAAYCVAVPGVTELRVGNYVFYDRMQVDLGVASLADCALSVLTTVSSCPGEGRAVIDAGSKTFAMDGGAHGSQRLSGFGLVLDKDCTIDRLSEEHGILSLKQDSLKVGDRLRVIPNHACVVMNLAKAIYLMEEDRVVESVFPEAQLLSQ